MTNAEIVTEAARLLADTGVETAFVAELRGLALRLDVLADIEERVFAIRSVVRDLRDPRRSEIATDLARLSNAIRAVRGHGEPL